MVTRDWPFGQRLVRITGVEVGARPDVEKDVFGNLVGRLEIFAAVQEPECDVGFGMGDGEG